MAKFIMFSAEVIKITEKAVCFEFSTGYAVMNRRSVWFPKSQLKIVDPTQKGMYHNLAISFWLGNQNSILDFNESEGVIADDHIFNISFYSDDGLVKTGCASNYLEKEAA